MHFCPFSRSQLREFFFSTLVAYFNLRILAWSNFLSIKSKHGNTTTLHPILLYHCSASQKQQKSPLILEKKSETKVFFQNIWRHLLAITQKHCPVKKSSISTPFKGYLWVLKWPHTYQQNLQDLLSSQDTLRLRKTTLRHQKNVLSGYKMASSQSIYL